MCWLCVESLKWVTAVVFLPVSVSQMSTTDTALTELDTARRDTGAVITSTLQTSGLKSCVLEPWQCVLVCILPYNCARLFVVECVWEGGKEQNTADFIHLLENEVTLVNFPILLSRTLNKCLCVHGSHCMVLLNIPHIQLCCCWFHLLWWWQVALLHGWLEWTNS